MSEQKLTYVKPSVPNVEKGGLKSALLRYLKTHNIPFSEKGDSIYFSVKYLEDTLVVMLRYDYRNKRYNVRKANSYEALAKNENWGAIEDISEIAKTLSEMIDSFKTNIDQSIMNKERFKFIETTVARFRKVSGFSKKKGWKDKGKWFNLEVNTTKGKDVVSWNLELGGIDSLTVYNIANGVRVN